MSIAYRGDSKAKAEHRAEFWNRCFSQLNGAKDTAFLVLYGSGPSGGKDVEYILNNSNYNDKDIFAIDKDAKAIKLCQKKFVGVNVFCGDVNTIIDDQIYGLDTNFWDCKNLVIYLDFCGSAMNAKISWDKFLSCIRGGGKNYYDNVILATTFSYNRRCGGADGRKGFNAVKYIAKNNFNKKGFKKFFTGVYCSRTPMGTYAIISGNEMKNASCVEWRYSKNG